MSRKLLGCFVNNPEVSNYFFSSFGLSAKVQVSIENNPENESIWVSVFLIKQVKDHKRNHCFYMMKI